MANIADSAFAVSKKDLDKLNGAIRLAQKGEVSRFVYRATYLDKRGHKHEFVDEWRNHERTLTLDGQKISDKEFRKKEYQVSGLWETQVYEDVSNGWLVDWMKLKTTPYQSEAYVEEHQDCLVVYFGGRWNFPNELEEHLNSLDIEWQGAALDDGMDWQTDELGTCDFGLRVVKDDEPYDTDEESGREYYGHHIELLSGMSLTRTDYETRKASLLDSLEYCSRRLGEQDKEPVSGKELRQVLADTISFIKEEVK